MDKFRIEDNHTSALIHQQIRDGWVMDDLRVEGDLSFAGDETLTQLPEHFRGCWTLDLTGCTNLQTLPNGLKVGALILHDCTSLVYLPNNLQVNYLDISGCTSLVAWGEDGWFGAGIFPQEGSVYPGLTLIARDCVNLSYLPDWIEHLANLNIAHCERIEILPRNLRVTRQIEIFGSGLKGLPRGVRDATVLWDRIPVDRRTPFDPNALALAKMLWDILQDAEDNETRQDAVEHFGIDQLLAQAHVSLIHEDRDAGGARRLLRVSYPQINRWWELSDETLLAVKCPSTGNQYYLGVPPNMRRCHDAAAWIAGFDNPKDYKPIIET